MHCILHLCIWFMSLYLIKPLLYFHLFFISWHLCCTLHLFICLHLQLIYIFVLLIACDAFYVFLFHSKYITFNIFVFHWICVAFHVFLFHSECISFFIFVFHCICIAFYVFLFHSKCLAFYIFVFDKTNVAFHISSRVLYF